MIKKLFQNLSEREKIESWSLSQKTKLSTIFFYLLVLFLPTQFGKHFWPDFSFIYGIRIDYLSPTVYLTDILILLIFISIVFENLFKIKRLTAIKTFVTKNIILFLFSIVLISISILFSKNQYVGIYGLIKLLEFVFLFSYTAKNLRKINVSVLLSCFILGAIFESVLAIFQYLNQGSIGGVFYFFGERAFNSQTPSVANASIGGKLILRPYGTFSHPNVLAGYLVSIMILIQIFTAKKIIKYQKALILLTITISSLALVLTMSRVAIAIWVIALLIFFVRNGLNKIRIIVKKEKTKVKILEKSILLFAIVLFIFITPSWSRLSQFNFSEQSLSQREQLIGDSWTMFKSNPVFGVGINNFLVNLPEVQKHQRQDLYLQPVHNIYLLILTQCGAIVFAISMFFLFKTTRRIRNRSAEFFVLFFGLIILGFFDHYLLTLQQGQILFALILGILWSNNKNDDKIKG